MATKTNSLFKCKSLYAKLLLAFFMAVFSSHVLYAYDFEVDGIYYKVLNEESVEVTSQNDNYPLYDSENEPSGNIVIPSTVSYGSVVYSVTSIGMNVFYHCTSLFSISIPESVTSIGYQAFGSCTSLISISIPESVTSIGDQAFISCHSLISISIPEGVTSIGYSAFDGCTSLTSISIPESVTSIGRYAFYGCTSLTSISIPEGVTSIGEEAFYDCTSLTSITCYAENVPELLGDDVFYDVPLNDATLYVPAFSIEKYKAADQWKNFGTILPIRIEISEEYFPDENFRNYLLRQSYGEDGYITAEEIKGITSMDVSNCSISSLQGIEYFTALATLYCNNNQIATLDISKNAALIALLCYDNQLSALDVSQNTKLTLLDCSGNSLTTLGTSNNPALTWLYCHDNKLTALDLSQNTLLRYLYCNDNDLTALDVSNNPELKSLECYNNNISGYAMDTFISSLPMNTGSEPQPLRLLTDDTDEGNSCTMEQAQTFKAKGWTPMIRIDGVWVEYEKPTAINNPDAEAENDDNAEYYTLDGKKVDTPTQKGIYIKNGKKVVIK